MANLLIPFSSGLILGTPSDDTITLLAGTSTTTIVGLGGNDVITSLLGDATLIGDVQNVILNFPSLSQTTTTAYDPAGPNPGVFSQIPVFGNDTLTSVFGNNKMYGDTVNFSINVTGPNNLAAGVSAAVVVTNLNVTFGNDTLTSFFGNATMFGDLDTFSVSVLAGSGGAAGSEATARIGVFGVAPGLTVVFGNNTFYTGSGDNIIYGDAREYDITLTSGSNSVGATARARLDAGTTTFGNNKVFAGDGDNYIFGALQNFNMNFTTGNNGSNNRAQDTNNYAFGSTEIHAGRGDNYIYGDAQNVIWNFIVGSGLDGTGSNNGAGFARWSGSTFQFGSDKIYVGDGDNHIYGHLQNWMFTGSVGQGVIGPNSIALPAIGEASNSVITFGNDVISAGNGNNWIYGDADTVLFKMTGSNNVSQVGTSFSGIGFGSLHYGNETISAGDGCNVVYGNINVMTENYTGGDHTASGSLSVDRRELFDTTFGNNTITVGSGGDTVYGNVGVYNMQFKAGDYGQGGAYQGALGVDAPGGAWADIFDSKTTFGDNKIYSGCGNDILVGNVGTLSMNFQGGQHEDGSSGPIFDVAGLIGTVELGANISPITFGSNEIHGGGGNDHIYGEGIAINISAIGGSIDKPYLGNPTITNPSTGNVLDPSVVSLDVSAGLGAQAPIIAGNNLIYGGSGTDVIYGDWGALNITLKDGTPSNPSLGTSTIPEHTQASIDTIQLGNNTIIGGSGNDTIVGGIGSINFKHLDASGHLITNNILDANSNVAHFISGNNILFGGAGNDVITGGSVGLTGNFGHDTFVYDGLLSNGKDTITDFHTALDSLVGQNGATFHDGGHNGSGDLVVKVWDAAGHNSSTITLQGVHDNFSAILPDLHYVASPIV